VRVGLVTDFYYPWIAGPSAAIRNLAHGLADRGHEVHVLAPSPTGPRGRECDGQVFVSRIPTMPVPVGYRLRASVLPRGVGRWLAEIGPDVVHVHHPFPISAQAVFTARREGVPVIATNHTIPSCSLYGLRRTGAIYHTAHAAFARWIVYLLNQCDCVTTPTDTAARLLSDLGFTRPVTTISNGIDCSRFSPRPPDDHLRHRLGLDGRPVVLYTGRLDSEKDMDTWLRAAASCAESADVQFVVGGEGAERSRLEAFGQRIGLGPRVRFIGYVEDDDLPALYRLATVYFITSSVELQSITTLEAVCSGLPVVAANAGALPELARPNANGFLFESGDHVAAARALSGVLTDNQSRERMSAESRRIGLEHDLARTVDKYEAHYRSLNAEGTAAYERAAAAG
jgi:1,2-diacylglycerol 3-alpha-glucosyltransferase